MNDLENDLLRDYTDIMKSEYYMVDFLWNRAKKRIKAAKKEEITPKAEETRAKIFKIFVCGIKEEYNQICDGIIQIISNEKLNELEIYYQEILQDIYREGEQFPQIIDNDFVSKTEQGIKYAREAREMVLQNFA